MFSGIPFPSKFKKPMFLLMQCSLNPPNRIKTLKMQTYQKKPAYSRILNYALANAMISACLCDQGLCKDARLVPFISRRSETEGGLQKIQQLWERGCCTFTTSQISFGWLLRPHFPSFKHMTHMWIFLIFSKKFWLVDVASSTEIMKIQIFKNQSAFLVKIKRCYVYFVQALEKYILVQKNIILGKKYIISIEVRFDPSTDLFTLIYCAT